MDKNIDVRSYNRDVWNNEVKNGNQWTIPVSPEIIAAARRGDWEIVLTPTKPVPRAWFGPLEGARTLCLASGGGQQGPVLAAAGAQVTVYDNSPEQLAQDRFVAGRDGLSITTVEGDMRDLSAFADESFDLIVHPCSNVFIPEVLPVWKEAWRVLKKGGILLAGFTNPILYIFEEELCEYGVFRVVNSLPYSDLTHLSAERLQQRMERREPLEFSHTLEEQIGGQLEAGFVLAGFFEDTWSDRPISRFAPTFIATRAIKL
jgi:SAM-dependent methyltransferase